MINIMVKEACNVRDELQARIDKLIEQIPADYPEEIKEDLAGTLNNERLTIEHTKPLDSDPEGVWRQHLQYVFEHFTLAKARVWEWEADAKSYRATIVHENGNEVSTVIDRLHSGINEHGIHYITMALERLYEDINGHDVRMGILTAVKPDREIYLSIIFPASKYYEALDYAAAGQMEVDTAHIKEMAINIMNAQLFFDTVIFENDRKAYIAARKAAIKKDRKAYRAAHKAAKRKAK